MLSLQRVMLRAHLPEAGPTNRNQRRHRARWWTRLFVGPDDILGCGMATAATSSNRGCGRIRGKAAYAAASGTNQSDGSQFSFSSSPRKRGPRAAIAGFDSPCSRHGEAWCPLARHDRSPSRRGDPDRIAGSASREVSGAAGADACRLAAAGSGGGLRHRPGRVRLAQVTLAVDGVAVGCAGNVLLSVRGTIVHFGSACRSDAGIA